MDEAAPPIWYEPLRRPRWLLPELRDGATRVRVIAALGGGLTEEQRDLRLGMAMSVAEALRFGSDAAAEAGDAIDVGGVTVRIEFLASDDARRLRVEAIGPSGESTLALDRPVAKREELGEIAPTIPGAVLPLLAPHDVHAAWAPVYQPPRPEHALDYAWAQRLVAVLRDSKTHGLDAGREVRSARLAEVTAHLAWLEAFAARATFGSFPELLFFAGLAATRDAGSTAFGDFRLQANGRVMVQAEQLETVFRLSPFVLRLFGDVGAAGQRERQLSSAAASDPAYGRWLDRVREGDAA